MAIDAAQVTAGPGLIYVAPVGTPEPTSAVDTLDVAFRQIGYTKEGSTLKTTTETVPVEVPWELCPVRYQITRQETSLGFEMAQSSVVNLAMALNEGSNAVTSTSFMESPAAGSDVRIMIALLAEGGSVWLFRQCVNSGDLSIAFRKAPDYKTIPVEFKLEKPYGTNAFRVYPAPEAVPTGTSGFPVTDVFGTTFGTVF